MADTAQVPTRELAMKCQTYVDYRLTRASLNEKQETSTNHATTGCQLLKSLESDMWIMEYFTISKTSS